jgi:hypothetical protein
VAAVASKREALAAAAVAAATRKVVTIAAAAAATTGIINYYDQYISLSKSFPIGKDFFCPTASVELPGAVHPIEPD